MNRNQLDRYDVATMAGLALLGAGAWWTGGAGGVALLLGLLLLVAGLLGAMRLQHKK